MECDINFDGECYRCENCGRQYRRHDLRVSCVSAPGRNNPPTPQQIWRTTPKPPPIRLNCQGEVLRTLEGREQCGCGGTSVAVIECLKFDTTAVKHALHARYMRAAEVTRCCVRCKARGEHMEATEVLHVAPDNLNWRWRIHVRELVAADDGLATSAHYVDGSTSDKTTLMAAIEQQRPRLVMLHAYSVSAVDSAAIARRFPSIRVIIVNHSTQAHLYASDRWAREQAAHLKNAAAIPNYYHGTPDERNFLKVASGVDRQIWVPNPIAPIEPANPKPAEPVVLLAARWDWIKNLHNQVWAVGLAQRQLNRRIRLVTTLDKKNGIESLQSVGDICGVKIEPLAWQPWPEWIDTLRRDITHVMQCSFADSFNYVAVEALLAGCPVVGSPAIRYLPTDWQADTDDPEEMAEILCNQIEREQSARARKIGKQVAAVNNRAYLELMRLAEKITER